MRIGLLSDSHIPEASPALPATLETVFAGVDLILHAGDIYIQSVLDDLERIAPVLAAKGDDDSDRLLLDKRVKMKHVLQIEGHTIWLLHELPYERMVTPWRKDQIAPHVVVFGHDHCTLQKQKNGVLFINPGSPTFLNYRRGPGTVAFLDISSLHVEASFLNLADQSALTP